MQGFFLYCSASGAVFQKFCQAVEGLAMVAGNRLGVEQAAENAFLHALCHRPEQRAVSYTHLTLPTNSLV